MLKFTVHFNLTCALIVVFYKSRIGNKKKKAYRIRASIKRNEMVMHVSKAFVEYFLNTVIPGNFQNFKLQRINPTRS